MKEKQWGKEQERLNRPNLVSVSLFQSIWWNMSDQWFSDLADAWEPPGPLAKNQTAGPLPRVSDTVGVGWGLMIYISNLFIGDLNAEGQGATLWLPPTPKLFLEPGRL